jgi:predicted nucleic acid-binding protein
MYLLDTNVVSALRRPQMAPPSLVAWAGSVAVENLFVSVITLYELELGIRRVERRDPPQGRVLRLWLERHVNAHFHGRILPIDDIIAARAAALQVPDPRPERDTFIAATALVHGLTVVTRNVRDFAPVATVNPWD